MVYSEKNDYDTKKIARLLSLYVYMICGEKIDWDIMLQVI